LKVVGSEGGPIPDLIQDGGGAGTTAPGQTAKATQNLADGKYFVVAMPEGDAKLAAAEMQVEGGSEGELPKTDAEIVAREYTFDAKGLK
jgi:hypothetical protein